MCKFILIQGKENAGKTTTCWKIYQDLVTMLQENNNGHPVMHEFIIPDREITLQTTSVMSVRELNVNVEGNGSSYVERSKDSLDFIAILPTESIKKIESNRLGIISAGDDCTMMIRAIQTCLKKNVDTIIISICSYQNSNNHFHEEKHILPLIEEKKYHNTKNVNFADYKEYDQEIQEKKVKEDVLKILFGTQESNLNSTYIL